MPAASNPLIEFEKQNAFWTDACLAVDLSASMVRRMSGQMPSFCLKAQAGPVLDAWLDYFQARNPGLPFHRLQSGVSVNDLRGGLDLHATIASGQCVYEKGILSKCSNGFLLLPLSSSPSSDVLAEINRVLDGGVLGAGNSVDGTVSEPAPGIIVIDESANGENLLPESLQDRLMFHLDLTCIRFSDAVVPDILADLDSVKPALCDAGLLEDLCNLSLDFGLTSLRPSSQALQIAAFHAGAKKRSTVQVEDISAAVRLALFGRAKGLPEQLDEAEETQQTSPQTQPDQKQDFENDANISEDLPQEMEVSGILASVPNELLSLMKKNEKFKRSKQKAGKSGTKSISYKLGRPIASLRGDLVSGRKLDLIATLRTAAPWQTVRRRQARNGSRVQVRRSDFHVKRYQKPSESVTIFVVDASGSTAVNRLGEAKGAVEILLGESYSRRDHVALISLRGTQAELVLQTTRSLTRARRALSGLPGGGGTPLAHGLQLAQLVAEEELRRGRSPQIVLLTDGSANIGLNGEGNRATATEDALAVAPSIAVLECNAFVLDVSRTANARAKKLADAMEAEYLLMPFASSKNISDAVRLAQN